MPAKSNKIMESARCAVIGHGSWATAIVKILHSNEERVGWYIRRPEVAREVRQTGRNPRYLTDVRLDTGRLAISEDLDRTVREADIVILAVPSAFLSVFLSGLSEPLHNKFVVSAIKGIIPDNHSTVAEYLNYTYGLPFANIGLVAGPCHSEEVALERLSYLTLVCKDPETASILCGKFSTPYIHTNPSTDIYGVEYASVLKNIYAIGAGIAVGLGYGDNFLSALIANAATEMERFLSGSYPAGRDITASAYMGDLLVTCYSQFSRNRTFGALIGKGYSVEMAQAGMKMVAEGYYAAKCIREVNKRFGIDMPIARCVYRILYGEANPAAEFREMSHSLR